MTDTAQNAKWYNENSALEHGRLLECRLEFAISLRVILDALDCGDEDGQQAEEKKAVKGGKKVLDLGGGTGRYAIELARRGHTVTLVDISASELQQAQSLAQEQNVVLEDIICEDALNLRSNAQVFKRDHFDLVLCQGPLYHLLEEEERLQVLRTCREILKTDGKLIAAFVTRAAHLRDLAMRDPERLVREWGEFYEGYLNEGKYTRGTKGVHSYHVQAGEVEGLFEKVTGGEEEEGKLAIERIVAAEGVLGGSLAKSMNGVREEVLDAWVNVMIEIGERREAWENGDHLLVVARKVWGGHVRNETIF